MISTATATPRFPGITSTAEQQLATFAGLALFPVLTSKLASGAYYIYDPLTFVDAPEDLSRVPGGGYVRGHMQLAGDKFVLKSYGFEEPLDRGESEKYGPEGAAVAGAIRRAELVVALNHERRAFALATSDAVPSADVVAGWNEGVGSGTDPEGDVAAARKAIFDATGLDANVMVISRKVFEALKANPKISAKIQFNGPDSKWIGLLAALFDVEHLIVAKGVVNSAAEGQLVKLSEIWDDHVILSVSDTTADFSAPSFGRTFIFDDPNLNERGIASETYDAVEIKSIIARARHQADEKITGASLAFHLKDVLK